jgi:hypothetical protein
MKYVARAFARSSGAGVMSWTSPDGSWNASGLPSTSLPAFAGSLHVGRRDSRFSIMERTSERSKRDRPPPFFHHVNLGEREHTSRQAWQIRDRCQFALPSKLRLRFLVRPSVELAKDSLPRSKRSRQIAPRNASLREIVHGVHKHAMWQLSWSCTASESTAIDSRHAPQETH